MRRHIPPVPRHPPPDADVTLDQAASILSASKKASRKKAAPIPPKRTSSFKDQQAMQAKQQAHMALHPGYYDGDPGCPENWHGGDSMVDSAFWFLNEDGVMESSLNLTDQHKSQSSSEELLSTPGSQSRSGSLERILENRIMSGVVAAGVVVGGNRSRSSSRDRSMSGSSPMKSSEQKTPDTDISESSLPPPPPDLLEDNPGALLPIQPPPPLPISPTLPQDSLPLGHLRQSLRKTRNYQTAPRPTADDQDVKPTTDETNITSLGSSNVKHVINRYGTIPKGARIGQFLASLENPQEAPVREIPDAMPDKRLTRDKLSDSCSNVAERVLKMPTPEVRRKVEEWQAGVDFGTEDFVFNPRKSSHTYADTATAMAKKKANAQRDHEHNVKPSALFRSSSIHEINSAATSSKPVGTNANTTTNKKPSVANINIPSDKPPLASFLSQKKSGLGKVDGQTDSQNGSHGNVSSPDKPQSPVPEWKRPKPKPSPLAQPKLQMPTDTIADENHSVSNPIKMPDTFKRRQEMFEHQAQDSGFVGSPPRSKEFTSRNASTSSDELLLDKRSQDSLDSLEQDQVSSRKTGVVAPRSAAAKRSDQKDQKSPDKISLTESSMESSTDSLMDSTPKVKLRNDANEKAFRANEKAIKEKEKSGGLGFKFDLFKSNKDKSKSKEDKKKAKNLQDSTKKGKDSQEVDKKGLFARQTEINDHSDPRQTPKSSTKFPKDGVVSGNVTAGKHLLPGARAVLPGLPAPGCSAVAVIPSPQQLAAKTLHHVSIDKERDVEDGCPPASKDTVIRLSKTLRRGLDELNNSKQKKHTSSFMHLSEEVQSFYRACSGYVESLPPHGKFHFRELLTSLQKISENLKTCSASNVKEYDRLLGDLLNSVKEIDAKLSR